MLNSDYALLLLGPFFLLFQNLQKPLYSLPLYFFSSIGGVTESTMRGASDALLSVISDIRESRQVS